MCYTKAGVTLRIAVGFTQSADFSMCFLGCAPITSLFRQFDDLPNHKLAVVEVNLQSLKNASTAAVETTCLIPIFTAIAVIVVWMGFAL